MRFGAACSNVHDRWFRGMLYDAEGSRLFECITTLPEYYPTRTERDILASCAEAIITATGSDYSR
jgi:uncharacterized SAM-dependent methyltransferase